MTHSKRKLAIEEIEIFRKFLERRGFKCRNGKGRDQLMQVQNQGAPGQNVFCKTAKGAVIYPAIFDDLVELFHAPVDPVRICTVAEACGQERPLSTPAKYIEGLREKEKLKSIQHDSDLLDDFAIAAMQAMASGSFNDPLGDKQLALRSYGIALAMMAERAKHQPK